MSQYPLPPAPAAYAPPVSPRPRPLWVLASLTIGGLAVGALLDVVASILDVFSYDAAEEALRAGGTGGAQERLVAVLLLEGAAGIASGAAFVFTMVAFICW